MDRQVLLKKFEQLEDSRQKLLNELKDAEPGKLLRKPAVDKWSVVQILYHLHSAESTSLGYVKKKMLGGDSLKKTGISASVRSMFLKFLLLSGYKWKAPQVLGIVPEELNYEEVILKWDETRDSIKLLIDTIPEKLIGREIYRNPRAGRLNLNQMLQFFADHFQHHLHQVHRLMKE